MELSSYIEDNIIKDESIKYKSVKQANNNYTISFNQDKFNANVENFETEVLPNLKYANLKSAKRIEFKKSVAEPMGLLKNQVTNVATDVSKGIGFQPMEGAQEAMKTADFVKFKVKKVASKPIKNNADFKKLITSFVAANKDHSMFTGSSSSATYLHDVLTSSINEYINEIKTKGTT
mgnify:CR=1 FL=1